MAYVMYDISDAIAYDDIVLCQYSVISILLYIDIAIYLIVFHLDVFFSYVFFSLNLFKIKCSGTSHSPLITYSKHIE